MKTISVVISVFNEEQVLPDFYKETVNVLLSCPWNYELIFINDGSTDGSIRILKEFAAKDFHVKVVNFSKNFGHEAAMIAGIDYSIGDGVICMDSDLQHPPRLILDIIDKFEQGYEVVNMIRTQNTDAGLLKNVTSKIFYRLLNLMSPVKFENNASDFFAMTNNVASVLKTEYREHMRFLRGYVQVLGFEKTSIDYKAEVRRAGESKYSMKKLLHFSVNALTSFSDLPLKLGIYSGIFVGVLGLILMIYTLYTKYKFNAPSGYATIIVAICFMFALLFFVIGIIGQYISIIFAEIKDRPIYTVRETINMDSEQLSQIDENASKKR